MMFDGGQSSGIPPMPSHVSHQQHQDQEQHGGGVTPSYDSNPPYGLTDGSQDDAGQCGGGAAVATAARALRDPLQHNNHALHNRHSPLRTDRDRGTQGVRRSRSQSFKVL